LIGRTDNKVKFQWTEFFRTKDWWIRKCLLQEGD